jgi:hypothetical protein
MRGEDRRRVSELVTPEVVSELTAVLALVVYIELRVARAVDAAAYQLREARADRRRSPPGSRHPGRRRTDRGVSDR